MLIYCFHHPCFHYTAGIWLMYVNILPRLLVFEPHARTGRCAFIVFARKGIEYLVCGSFHGFVLSVSGLANNSFKPIIRIPSLSIFLICSIFEILLFRSEMVSSSCLIYNNIKVMMVSRTTINNVAIALTVNESSEK